MYGGTAAARTPVAPANPTIIRYDATGNRITN
jgi:hypothetical protein